MLELKLVSSTEMIARQRQEVVRLCSDVFHMDYARYMNLGFFSVHVLGYLGDRLVSHALWLERRLRVGAGPWLTAAYVEGVATDAGFRNQGYASAVVRRVQREVVGFDFAALSPAYPGWYERLGWLRWRGQLFILKDGVLESTPDDLMVYPTPRSPVLDLDASMTGEWWPFELW